MIKTTTYHYIRILALLLLVFSGCNQEVSVTPPDVPPPDGFIFIDSNPQGAQIFVNNKFTRRVTPDSIKFLATNSYNITLKKDYFRDTSFVANITEGVKSNILVDYTKNPLMQGKINCTTIPDNSEIFLNGAATGLTTPTVLNNILPGQYVVSFHHTNHIDDSVSVIVKSNTTTAAKTTLVDTTVWNYYNTSNSGLITNKCTAVGVDYSNNVWVGTEDEGLFKYNGVTWKQFVPANSIIPASKVSSIVVNKDGTVWVGTKFGLLLTGTAGMQRYNSFDWGSPLLDSNIKSMFTDGNNTTYIVTDTTIVKSYLNGSFRKWFYRDSTILKELVPHNIKFTSYAMSDKENYDWIGTEDNGIISYNTVTRYNTSNTNEIGNNVNAMATSQTGIIWIGYNWSLPAQSSISYLDHGILKAPGITPLNSNTNSIFIDENDTKWLGTTAGLIAFTNLSTIKRYNKESTGLDINDVRGIAKDSQGRIWIATRGGGLIVKKK